MPTPPSRQTLRSDINDCKRVTFTARYANGQFHGRPVTTQNPTRDADVGADVGADRRLTFIPALSPTPK